MMLSNQRHERFAQELAQGKTAVEAYALAGYRMNRANAARLAANSAIRARVEALQVRAATKVEATVEVLALELEDARALAMAEKQTNAAVSAIMGKAKLFGLGSETRKVQGRMEMVTLDARTLAMLTAEELDALEAILLKLSIGSPGDGDGDQSAALNGFTGGQE